MNVFGISSNNTHVGNVLITEDLTVEGDLAVEGKLDYEGNIEIVPPASLITDSIEAATPAGIVFEDSSSTEVMRFTNAKLQLESGLITDEVKTKTPGATFEVLTADGSPVIRAGPDLRLQTAAYSFPRFDGTPGSIMATDGKGDVYWEGLTTGTLVSQAYVGTVQNISYPKGIYNPIESSGVGTKFIPDEDFPVGSAIRIKASGVYNSSGVTFPAATLGNFRLDVNDAGGIVSEYFAGTQIQNSVTLRGYWNIEATLIRRRTSEMRIAIAYITTLDQKYEVQEVAVTPTAAEVLTYSGAGVAFSINYVDNSPLNLTQRPYFTSYTIEYSKSVGFPTVAPPATSDHLALTNLVAGDSGHTQFALLAGRSGGQSLTGGTTPGQSLLLASNSGDATTGAISTPSPILGLSYGFQTHPDSRMEIAGTGDLTFLKGGVEKLRISTAQATLSDSLVISFNNPALILDDTLTGGSATVELRDAGGSNATFVNNSSTATIGSVVGSNSIAFSHLPGGGVAVTAGGANVMLFDNTQLLAARPLQMTGSTIFGHLIAGGDLTLQSTTQATRGSIIMSDDVKLSTNLDSTPATWNIKAAGAQVASVSSTTGLDVKQTLTASGDFVHTKGVVEVYTDNSTLITNTTTIGLFVPIQLTSFIANLDTFFSISNVGNTPRITYTGNRTRYIHGGATVTMSPAKKAQQISFMFYKNGSPVPGSKVSLYGDKDLFASFQSTAIHKIFTLNTNDYIELYAANEDATDTIRVTAINIFGLALPNIA